MFNKIVVGLDGSDVSDRALHLSCNLAQKYDSDIHLVHTPQPQTVAFALGAVAGYHTVTTMPTDKEVIQACNNILDSANEIARQYNLKIQQTHIDRGDPAQMIVACAEECSADLIVTGRRGLGSLNSLLQGSTSLKVNHLAKCACLSVS